MARSSPYRSETVPPRDALPELRALKHSIGDLSADSVARLVSASADIALVISSDGIIEDVTVGNEELPRDEVGQWVGQHWIETVTVESRHKVKELLEDANARAYMRSRQINHPSMRGPDLPVRYSVVKVGEGGRVVALGRELRSLSQLQQHLVDAQQSMEREYARLRHAETRYRLLFQKSSEAVVIVDVAGLRVVEANPASADLLGRPVKRLVGRPFLELLEPSSVQAAQNMVATARISGQASDVRVHVATVGGEGKAGEIIISPSLFRQANAAHFLMRLAPVDAAGNQDAAPILTRNLQRVVESLPDGFVVTSLDQAVLTANSSFLDLAQLASVEQARGGTLDQWVGRSSVELKGLVSNIKEHGSARNFTTVVRGQFGSVEDVEISAVAVTAGADPCLGFTLRPLGRRLSAAANPGRELPHSTKQLTELVGRVPMKSIVRDTTDLIEKLCIEAALELAGDNRVSAAEMLGLSRQSLYVKLRRYGLVDPMVEET